MTDFEHRIAAIRADAERWLVQNNLDIKIISITIIIEENRPVRHEVYTNAKNFKGLIPLQKYLESQYKKVTII